MFAQMMGPARCAADDRGHRVARHGDDRMRRADRHQQRRRLGRPGAIDAFDWPNLGYTMHDGPRASDAMFLAHGVAAVITGVVLALRQRPTGHR